MSGRATARWIAGAALLVLAVTWARAETPAHEQAPCDERAAVPGAAPLWRVPADAPHGVKALDSTTSIAFQTAVPAFTVEIWGAGGGGGGGSLETISESGYGGGGGASGSYLQMKLPATPGTVYTVVVGRGGAGGEGRSSTPGKIGGDSALCDGPRALALAAGGHGGQPGHVNHGGGQGGRPGDVSTPDDNQLGRSGNAGLAGGAPLFELRGIGGTGGKAIAGTLQPRGAFGGNGGNGAITSGAPGDGLAGGNGFAVMTW
jgi:hypothetical protein